MANKTDVTGLSSLTVRQLRSRRRRVAKRMGDPEMTLRGSLISQGRRCGKSGCACHNDPPTLHGPYIQWTRAVGGKTVTRYLSEEELARYQPWFDNARRLKEIAAKLEIASLHALEIERSERPSSPTPGAEATGRVTRRRRDARGA